MLGDMAVVAKGLGLEFHMGKTKIPSNGEGPNCKGKFARMRGGNVEILAPWVRTAYLGKDLSVLTIHETELGSQLAKAERTFPKYRCDLCDRHHPLTVRLKLFDAVITPTALYGSCTWTMSAGSRRRMPVSQCKMLRNMIGERWSEEVGDEDDAVASSTNLIKSATAKVTEQIALNTVSDWCVQQRHRKWNWAGNCARINDGRWTRRTLEWQMDCARKQW